MLNYRYKLNLVNINLNYKTMKTLITTIFILISSTALANNCMMQTKPIPPIGCGFENAQCACQGYNNCYWIYTGCNS